MLSNIYLLSIVYAYHIINIICSIFYSYDFITMYIIIVIINNFHVNNNIEEISIIVIC